MKKSGHSLRVKCWVSSKNEKPVREWLEKLDLQSFKQIDKLLSLLRLAQKDLSMPYSRHLGGGLFELRDQRQSGPGYRLYYCWSGEAIVILLVGGEKSSQERDIIAARKRMKEEE